MKKIIDFLQNSNHYKQLIGGFIVSWLTASPYTGIYAAVVEQHASNSKTGSMATSSTSPTG